MVKPEDLDRTPPWHPFELNSELTLESIVEDGYRFIDMPCGQVQYIKQVGDTSIQYEVEIDCNKYDEKIRAEVDFVEEENDNKEYLAEDAKSIEEEIAENKYYPRYPEEIKGCYQNISFRVFPVSLSPAIDSLAIRKYVDEHGGNIMESTENWNSQKGGSFMVNHYDSKLYFYCTISKEYTLQPKETNWQFQIIRQIPHLDKKSIIKENERKKMIYNYYEEFDEWDL